MLSMLIAGSGRMARSIGTFFIEKGCPVSFYSRSEDRAGEMKHYIGRHINRLRKLSDNSAITDPHFYYPGIPGGVPHSDIILESIEEDLGAKKDLVSTLVDSCGMPDLLLSNSSSLFPWTIHPQ
jgi:3-hydroxyacyl-CoA dehydrogenase